jgi:hypothetical protein
MGKRHRPEAVMSGPALRPAILYGKPGATPVHPMTPTGTATIVLDSFPISIYNSGMETLSPTHPAIDLSTPLYYQLVYTLTDLLPPPLDDTPAALRARNLAAIAKVAALLPVNANEADLAAQCIAARAQAEEMLRLLRQHADDIGLVMRLNAQYGSMVRTSLSVHARLMRVQALRQKQEAIGAANEDAWVQHVAERSMLAVVDPAAGSLEAARPAAVAAEATRVEVPAACVDQRIAEDVSDDGMDSQHAAFETWLSEQPWNLGARRSGEPGPGEVVREAMADSPFARSLFRGRDLPANGRESPARAD